MILVDVNVLVAAHRADHSHHALVTPWFEALLDGAEAFTVPDAVWASFIRIVTHRRIFPVPSPTGDAFAFVRAVRAQPGHLPTAPSARHLDVFERVCADGQATGDLVPDAYLAALALDQGAAVATLDRDFTRFAGLRVVTPPVPS